MPFPRDLMGRVYVKPRSWRRRLLKLLVVLVVLALAGAYIGARYRIGHDQQYTLSIPGNRVYLIDLWDHDPERGARYAFRSSGMAPIFEDGSLIVKIMSGLPGDHIQIGDNRQIIINGEPSGFFGLYQATTLGKQPEDFEGEGDLSDGEFWFLAPHRLSIDSRYYGSVSKDRIVGRAYPLY